MLKLFNSLTRSKELFSPQKQGHASIYACGPTVYWFAHIGNMRTNIFVDTLRRVLEFNGNDVDLVMNITDVGHLTDDANDGEDKMIVAMQREGKTAYEIAEFYTNTFFEDLKRLNIKPAREYPRATVHIAEQIEMVKQLEANGFTYTTSDGVYFDTSKLETYGQLSGQSSNEKKAGARVDMGEKRNATDFALWKFSPSDTQREMEWESPWGKGFPGWHIECSAMSVKYLGAQFDIHTGGIDHIPVHHENELAQTRGALGVLQANVWMHGEFLTVNNGKMSKSLGNLYTINDLAKKGFDPLAYRYYALGAHYRTKLNFTFEGLEAAQNALTKLRVKSRVWDAPTQVAEMFKDQFLESINDDLNTPQALAVVWEMVESDIPSAQKSATLSLFDQVLGLGLDEYIATPLEVPTEVQKILDQRAQAREKKDWETSDELRNTLLEMGYSVEDTDEGQKITQS